MKKSSIFWLILLPTMVVSCQSTQKRLTTDEFEHKAQTPNTLIVDVRTPEEYSSGHINGAVNINFYDNSFEQQIKQLPANKIILVYCKSGNRSGKATSAMENMGFKQVYDLEGGINNWLQKGKPIE